MAHMSLFIDLLVVININELLRGMAHTLRLWDISKLWAKVLMRLQYIFLPLLQGLHLHIKTYCVVTAGRQLVDEPLLHQVITV